jgi:hypothetical protein
MALRGRGATAKGQRTDPSDDQRGTPKLSVACLEFFVGPGSPRSVKRRDYLWHTILVSRLGGQFTLCSTDHCLLVA